MTQQKDYQMMSGVSKMAGNRPATTSSIQDTCSTDTYTQATQFWIEDIVPKVIELSVFYFTVYYKRHFAKTI